jgi:DNA-binding response OmpR family regulator
MNKLKTRRILLAGLDQHTAQKITENLSATKILIDYEYHRDDILHALELQKYDLVIVGTADYLSTFRICTEIRDELLIPDIPILIFSQELSQTTLRAFEEINVNLFVEKPVTHDEFITVSRIISSLPSSPQ